MTPREFVDQELKLIEQTFDKLKVLEPMVVFIKEDRRAIVLAEFHNNVHKDIISQGIKDLVKKADPDIVVYSAEAWAINVKEYDDKTTYSPLHHPDRIEIVCVRIEFKTGEKFDCSARILRKSGKAWLSKFEVIPGGMSMGRFVDFYPIGKMN